MKQWKLYTSLALLLTLAGSAVLFSKIHKPKIYKSIHTSPLTKEDKHFVIIIPSYNNSLYCEDNIRSVLTQDYPHFRVIYIDDCSTDDTAEKVQNHVATCFPNAPLQLIKNTKRKGNPLANLYYAIQSCQDNEIVVVVDGDDRLAHRHVLSKLNTVYANPKVWLTYGNYIDHPGYTNKSSLCRKFSKHVIKDNLFRNHPWISSHLRTFYAGLFKKIKLKDLLLDGEFYPMAGDLASMFPMLEMAGEHHKYIKDVLYLYNRENPINEDKVNVQLQALCDHKIRSLPKYHRLESLAPINKEAPADLIIFSYDRPLQLYALLESVQRYMHNLASISIVYRTSTADYEAGYQETARAFPSVHFITQSPSPHADFKPLVMRIISETPSNHVLFAVDDMIAIDHVDIAKAVEDLERTGAYGVYLAHGNEINYSYMENRHTEVPPCIEAGDNLYIWQFQRGSGDWAYPNSLDMVLYRKQDVIRHLSKMDFINPNTLESQWHAQAKLNKMGLFYSSSKIVNIPLNLVNISSNRCPEGISAEDLLHKFQSGYKIDINPLFQIPHSSRHMEYIPEFVIR